MKGCNINIINVAAWRCLRSALICVAIALSISLFSGCGSIEGLADLADAAQGEVRKVEPIVVLTGSTEVKFALDRLLSPAFKHTHSPEDLQFEVELNEQIYPLEMLNAPRHWRVGKRDGFDSAGWGDIVLKDDAGEVLRLKKILRVIDKFRITLTFDDGPSIDKKSPENDISTSPTVITLDGLDKFVHGENSAKTGVKAAFFVLTTQDEFFKIKYSKAETEQGKAILREVASRGHVIGVHSGGAYKTQTNGHDKRALQPAYSVQGAPAENFENALEADLHECVSTIRAVTGQVPEFVRPPIWKYSNKYNPEVKRLVLQAYDKFGLKMILTDAKFPDGGYYLISIVAVQKYIVFRKNLVRAFLSGEDNLVLSMHDANSYTANIIGNILEMLVAEFEKVDFAGNFGSGGSRLDFADTAAEVRDNLRLKKRYTLFPSYHESE